jgi:uncharacterized phosphatase
VAHRYSVSHLPYKGANLATVIGLLRHGQTDWNIDMRLQGVSNIPMNLTGHSQAKTAAQVISKDNWHRVITSPLDRAVDTANYVIEELKLDRLEIEPLLLERSFGAAEGLSYEDWRERLQAGVIAEGAESNDALELRARKILQAFTRFENENVVAVSHGALIRKLIDVVSQGEFPRDGDKFGNASMTTITFENGIWSILNYDTTTLTN